MTSPGGGEFTVFRLPRSLWHAHLWNFDWARVRPAELKTYATDFLSKFSDNRAPHMLLMGPPGIGKSHLGAGIYRAAVAVWGTELCTWINVPAFYDQVKRSYDAPSYGDPWQDYEGARRLVVLDDLFGRDPSAHEASQILYRLIDTAYRNGASMLVNMNQTMRELGTRLAAHEISRLLADVTPIEMSGTDKRLPE